MAGHGVRQQIVDPDYNNFAPRVGLAYQLAKNTVFRAGGGIYYATDNANELQFEIVGAPFYSSQTLTSSASHAHALAFRFVSVRRRRCIVQSIHLEPAQPDSLCVAVERRHSAHVWKR